jgi:hypothetical protein
MTGVALAEGEFGPWERPSDANSSGHLTNIVATNKNTVGTKLRIVFIGCLSAVPRAWRLKS